MPTRVQNEPSGGLISYFYTDALTGKPITIAKTETQVVNGQSCIQLKELPYRFTRVRITNRSMNEVDNADEVTNSSQFYVDYPNGMIYFYPSIGSATVTFSYDSIGYVYTTSTRIATQWDGTTVIETLQDMMNTMNHAILVSTTYATADDLIKDIEARTLVCNNSITTKISDANTSINSKISDANNKITDVNTAITNANTAKTNLETAIANATLDNYQMKNDNTLTTTAKTIVGAVNELETLKQNITDNGLKTVNKTVQGAINEIHDVINTPNVTIDSEGIRLATGALKVIESDGNQVFEIVNDQEGNPGIELGRYTVGSTPYIDFHSSGAGGDYDSRIIATDGNGSNSSGNLIAHCSTFKISGNLNVLGAKNRAVKTDHYGTRALNAYETTDCLFGDIGNNTVVDGTCRIDLDTIFLETVTTDGGYNVFLTKYAKGDIWVDEMGTDYFVVKGDNIPFAWEIKAKQKGYENNRLELIQ